MIGSKDELTGEELLSNLRARRALARTSIYVLSTVDPEDPRREDALRYYNAQLRSIDEQIAAITGRIPPVVIGLQPAILFPQAQGVTR